MLKFNNILQLVEVHVPAKFHQTKFNGSEVIVSTNVFALSRNVEESEKSGPLTLTFDRGIQ